MTEGKRKLLELEKTGKYFFHGSPSEVEVFEPRQSHNTIDGVQIKDGDPAVSASPAIDYAIFMAIINSKNCSQGSSSSTSTHSNNRESDQFTLSFHVTENTWKQLNENASGWVYVFNREDFPFKKTPSEYRSHVHVSPIERILVFKEDLPENIEIK